MVKSTSSSSIASRLSLRPFSTIRAIKPSTSTSTATDATQLDTHSPKRQGFLSKLLSPFQRKKPRQEVAEEPEVPVRRRSERKSTKSVSEAREQEEKAVAAHDAWLKEKRSEVEQLQIGDDEEFEAAKKFVNAQRAEREAEALTKLNATGHKVLGLVEGLVLKLQKEKDASLTVEGKKRVQERIEMLQWVRGTVLHELAGWFANDIRLEWDKTKKSTAKGKGKEVGVGVDEAMLESLEALGKDFWALISQFGKSAVHPSGDSALSASFTPMGPPPKNPSRPHQGAFRRRVAAAHGYLDEITRAFDTILDRFAGFDVQALLGAKDEGLDLYRTSNGFLGVKPVNTNYDNLGLSIEPCQEAFLPNREPSEPYRFKIHTHTTDAEIEINAICKQQREGTFSQHAQHHERWLQDRNKVFAMPDPKLLRLRHAVCLVAASRGNAEVWQRWQQEREDEAERVEAEQEEEMREEWARKPLLDVPIATTAEKIEIVCSPSESLASLRGLYTSLQSSHSKLEANLQEATTTSRTSLLRIQTLTSTITSLGADKTFLTSELTQGRAEWFQHRRETHTTIVRLQTEAENAGIELRDTKSSLASLRTAHDALNERYQAVLEELKTVKEERDSNEGNFASEMGSMKRLVEMMERREEERKKRLEEVEQGLEEDRMAREAREEELKEEVEIERRRSDELEVKCAELREAIERGAASFRGTLPGEDVPGSPNGAFTLSPSAQIAVRGQKSGRSYAEVYGEYVRMQEELARERSETKRLGDVLTQVLGDIEERAPILKQQRVEYDRLSVEATQLAAQLAQAMSDRENAQCLAEGYRLDVDRLERDATLQSSQLRDLGRQVRTLLRQLGSVELNLSNPDEFDEEEAAIRQRALESSDTDAVVSAHLVTFKTINELQLQNQKLLKITREMGAQMERGEEDAIARRRAEENAAVQEAHELILSLKEVVESQRAKMEAYVRERDMFRRMLAQHGEGGGTNGVGGAGGDGETPRLLADVQANFDAYRTEIAIDTQRLREDLSQAQREANTARTDLAKAKAQSEFVSERLRLLNDNYALQTDEIKQLSKRASQLQESVVKQETANHKLTEDLLELRSTSDQLRHENINLKSEREVWKSVENRLVEENSALSRERAHLADLMQNLQTMQNGLESSGGGEKEAGGAGRAFGYPGLRERISHETDASRQLALRKELEAKTFQDRVDKLTAEHQETREALIMARAAKEHLDQRVADLSAQVTAREEKLRVYEGRTSASEESSQTREQQLEGDCRRASTDLETAKAHVQQYKAIAETEGDSLRDITATYDEFKAGATPSALPTTPAPAASTSASASSAETLPPLVADPGTTAAVTAPAKGAATRGAARGRGTAVKTRGAAPAAAAEGVALPGAGAARGGRGGVLGQITTFKILS
ncbi:nucleoprotein TPR [Pseudohyphozyma bogoriensis]|nr:nucleoprotein TPR [Pseudohyphozyma bogoriensis]